MVGCIAFVRGAKNANLIQDDLPLKIGRMIFAFFYGIFILIWTLVVELVKNVGGGILEIGEACILR